jgi:phosphoglycolate phosphatase-like HAD superfamily hydrolase
VVGAGDYEHLGRLRYAEGDAEKFARALVARLGFEEDAVRLLTDRSADPRLTPTAGHVIGELEALLADQRGAPSDLFVFYFSGHGVGLPEGDYLLPTDARRESALRVGLPVREIVDRLAAERAMPRAPALRAVGTELRLLLDLRAGDSAARAALRAAPVPEPDYLLRALRALSLRAAGEHEAAEALTLWLEDQNPGASFFAAAAVLAARPDPDPLAEAFRASSLQPGNPLAAQWSFAGDAGLAAFSGAYSFTIERLPESGEGDLAALGAALQFTMLPDGRVLGALILAAGEALVGSGSLDARGNLEAVAQRGAGAAIERFTLLAKLAPPPVQSGYAPLRAEGQRFDVLRPDGLRRMWAARFDG